MPTNFTDQITELIFCLESLELKNESQYILFYGKQLKGVVLFPAQVIICHFG